MPNRSISASKAAISFWAILPSDAMTQQAALSSNRTSSGDSDEYRRTASAVSLDSLIVISCKSSSALATLLLDPKKRL